MAAMESRGATYSSSCRPDAFPPECHDDSLIHHHHHHHHPPRLGTVIPNRIFVGGIDCTVNESDLLKVFSQHGTVKEVKIVINRSGMSKRYGFVTFESQDDALRILHNATEICFKDKKLNIGQAIRKQQAYGQISTAQSGPMSSSDSAFCGTLHQTMSTGYQCTYDNGVAYFHRPSVNHPPLPWPPAAPVMLLQAHQQQPVSHHYQCVPHQYQWSVAQTPSAPVMYSQQTEYPYQPVDRGSVLPTLAVLGGTTEGFQLCPQRTEGLDPIVLQHGPGKNQMFAHPHVCLKPQYHGHMDHGLPEAAEPLDGGTPYTVQPLT